MNLIENKTLRHLIILVGVLSCAVGHKTSTPEDIALKEKLDVVVFENDSLNIPEKEKLELEQAIKTILPKMNKNNFIVIRGDSYRVGGRIKSREIVLNRILKVKNELIRLGLKSDKIIVRNQIKAQPLFNGSTSFSKKSNREIIIKLAEASSPNKKYQMTAPIYQTVGQSTQKL